MLKWILGRQKTGYEKLKLWSFWRTDCYILRYKPGTYIHPHKDPVVGRKHWRLNVVLKKPQWGGIFFSVDDKTDAVKFWENQRIILFRSDLVKHGVSEVIGSNRIVLSLGVAI